MDVALLHRKVVAHLHTPEAIEDIYAKLGVSEEVIYLAISLNNPHMGYEIFFQLDFCTICTIGIVPYVRDSFHSSLCRPVCFYQRRLPFSKDRIDQLIT